MHRLIHKLGKTIHKAGGKEGKNRSALRGSYPQTGQACPGNPGLCKETAKALSRLISEGKTEKYYFAVVCGKPVEKEGTFVDYLRKDPKKNESAVVDKTAPGAREARLSYQVLESRRIDGEDLSLVGIRLETGRHHQIRVQFSSHGLPLWGDNRYHPDFQNGKRRGSIALCAAGLAFVHPITGKRMEFSINPRGAAFSWFEKPQVYFAGGDAY